MDFPDHERPDLMNWSPVGRPDIVPVNFFNDIVPVNFFNGHVEDPPPTDEDFLTLIEGPPSKAEERRLKGNERQKKFYHRNKDDPEYVARRKEILDKSRKKNPISAGARKEYNARHREKYRYDDEHNEKKKEYDRRYYIKKKKRPQEDDSY
jgi:hypothetical protein